MVTIQIPDKLAQKLEKVAQRENRSLEEIAASVLQDFVSAEKDDETQSPSEGITALDALMGMFDDDVTDMSSNVKETLREYYRNKYGRPD